MGAPDLAPLLLPVLPPPLPAPPCLAQARPDHPLSCLHAQEPDHPSIPSVLGFGHPASAVWALGSP